MKSKFYYSQKLSKLSIATISILQQNFIQVKILVFDIISAHLCNIPILKLFRTNRFSL